VLAIGANTLVGRLVGTASMAERPMR